MHSIVKKLKSTSRTAKKAAAIGAAALAVLAIVTLGIIAAPSAADAQEDAKAITNFGLYHNNAWHLIAEWDEPDQGIPNDYRVRWAKASEDYKTWTDESGNAFPNTNRHDITGLERGVEYKAQVRARYGDGSGPWSTERTYTIPAPTPTPAPTATPEPTQAPQPQWDGTTMPPASAMFNWAAVENAVGYELEMNVPENGADRWWNITQTDPDSPANAKAYVHGTTAIIGQSLPGPVHLRVRATFSDSATGDWHYASVNTSE